MSDKTTLKATQLSGQAKVITKTVNRSGKSLVKKALVVKAKNQSKISVENIKKLNEKLKQEKEILEKKKTQIENEPASAKATVAKEDKKYKLTIG
jgi:mannose-1-phosphate guanylyltransferase